MYFCYIGKKNEMRKKSLFLAGALALFFGPFGIFYSSIGLGFLMFVVELVLLFFLSAAIANAALSAWAVVGILAGVNVLASVLAARGRNKEMD